MRLEETSLLLLPLAALVLMVWPVEVFKFLQSLLLFLVMALALVV